MKDRICLFIIRYSDGIMRCFSGTYEAAVKVAEDYVRDTGMTYTIS